MPPQDYPDSAAPAPRDLFESTGSEINGKNIALIIFVAIVPVLIAAGVVSWLLCCYSRGRGCGRRKKDHKTATSPANENPSGTEPSAGQKMGRPPMAQNAPSRPAQAHTRNDSLVSKGSSSSGKYSNEKVPTLPKGFV